MLLSGVCSSGIRAYEQLGYRAFGTPGKMAAGIAITLQNIGGEVTHCNLSSYTHILFIFVTFLGYNSVCMYFLVCVFMCEGCFTFSSPCFSSNSLRCTYLQFTAMSSYLFIVKYEFPLVLQAFLEVDKPAGWVQLPLPTVTWVTSQSESVTLLPNPNGIISIHL